MDALAFSDWFTTLSLVFGGCCSNAITLEQLTSEYPQAGSLITFFQFVIVSLHGLPKHITWTRFGPRFRPRRIPLMPYLIQVALFYFISLLNNAAFGYRIPMTVHIIFRSGGLVITMLLGWLFARKTYSFLQVVSVLLVTLGVILTTLSASPVRVSQSKDVLTDSYTYATGIVILTLALVFSGFLGLVQDWTYSRYGRPSPTTPSSSQPPAWQESMFYLHFLALPMFVSVRHDLLIQIHALNSGPRSSLPGRMGSLIPAASVPLIINTLTQLLCVSGVNRLTTKVTALTVTLILVVRKAASLVLSIIGVGIIQRGKGSHSDVDKGMLWSGAGMVLVGTVIYSLGSKSIGRIDNKKRV